LGLKRTGLGAGKYAGFGGKVKAGETVTRAAVRELEEETGVRADEKNLRQIGLLTFLFPARPAWSQKVHVFLVTRWGGEPLVSEEMRPVWFAMHNIPYKHMWQDGPHWLPTILAGERIQATFTYEEDNETLAKVGIEAQGDRC
jgi:8-oxo-dGTP pyrophosphatase MutT (NUDIX family)